MKRIFLNKGETIQEHIEIFGEDAHHIGYSLRGRVGEIFEVVDTNGRVAKMQIENFSKHSVGFRLLFFCEEESNETMQLTLAMALLKQDKFDFVVQKATELGVAIIQPLVCETCVVRYDEKKSLAKEIKWQKIADEAAKQCGRKNLVKVLPIQSFENFIQSCEKNSSCLCYEDEKKLSLQNFLHSFENPRQFSLIIGAEGGFSKKEIALAHEKNISCVSLGKNILRAETAAIASISIVQFLFGSLGK